MKNRLFLFCGLILCGETARAGQANDLLANLSNDRQLEIMSHVLRDEPCGGVVRIFYKGDNASGDTADYALRCSNGKDYLIAIQNSGNMSSKILDCKTVKALGMDCWRPY